MSIKLLRGAKPVRSLIPYTIPIHWQEDVLKMLKDMDVKGITKDVPIGESPE